MRADARCGHACGCGKTCASACRAHGALVAMVVAPKKGLYIGIAGGVPTARARTRWLSFLRGLNHSSLMVRGWCVPNGMPTGHMSVHMSVHMYAHVSLYTCPLGA